MPEIGPSQTGGGAVTLEAAPALASPTADLDVQSRAIRARAHGHAVLGGLAFMVGILVLWQLWIWVDSVPSLVMPAPLTVLGDIVDHPGVYLSPAWGTIWLAVVGLVIGMIAGSAAAVICWTSETLRVLITPTALLIQSVPIVAFIPVLARLLGYSNTTVIAIDALISLLPAFVLVGSGLRMVPPGTSEVFSAWGASRVSRLRLLAIPSAAPRFLTALRIAAAGSIGAAVAAEYLMGSQGLGLFIVNSANQANLVREWGGAVIAVALSMLSFVAAAQLEVWGNRRLS
ncbi:MAG TPA: ABC transporter permease subunit [Solirubrobacteraceae bacterium]|jgi:NitT/TauT family transport system permease protein